MEVAKKNYLEGVGKSTLVIICDIKISYMYARSQQILHLKKKMYSFYKSGSTVREKKNREQDSWLPRQIRGYQDRFVVTRVDSWLLWGELFPIPTHKILR